ncbi:MAG: LamG-like jellyroll fold domain-containing protein [Candidatus Gracilibacteria bacterium]
MQTPQKTPNLLTKSYSGFTLVELIVVITILVILGTIAFMNLSGFQSNARDSVRIENLTNLKKGLDIFQIKSGKYPLPENSVNITASGTLIGYQGFAKDQVGSLARLSQNGTIDPLDSTIYTTYSTNADRTKMQAMSFLEDGNNVIAMNSTLPRPLGEGWAPQRAVLWSSFIPEANASVTSDYSKRYPSTQGDSLGILLGNSGGSLNQPVQETGSGVDIFTKIGNYIMQFSNTKKVIGSSSAMSYGYLTYYSNIGLSGYWSFDQGNGNIVKDDSGNGNSGNFIGSPLWGTGKLLGGIDVGNGGGYARIPNSSSIDLGNQITIAFWIKDSGTSAVWGSFISKINMGTSGYMIQRNESTQDIYMRIDTSTGVNQTIGIIPNILDGNWHHIVWTLDNGAKKGFKDGILIINENYSPGNGFSITSQPLDIAAYLIGKIDEVRIYNRALSDSEAQALYNATK